MKHGGKLANYSNSAWKSKMIRFFATGEINVIWKYVDSLINLLGWCLDAVDRYQRQSFKELHNVIQFYALLIAIL